MKLVYTILIVLSTIITGKGQSFSISDLIKMSNLDKNSFDSFATNNGFVFIQNVNTEYISRVEYEIYYTPTDKTNVKKYLHFYTKYYSPYKRSIFYTTKDKNEYLRIKNEIKQLGFKLFEPNKNFQNSQYFRKDLGNFEIVITTRDVYYEINLHVNE